MGRRIWNIYYSFKLENDMKNDVLITVNIAIFNGSSYVRNAIESILNQTYKNFELLIINDGSTDNSLEIINSFKDDRIRVLNNDKNRGLIYSRNRAVKESRGKYFAILDCDDYSYSHRLEAQCQLLESHPEIAICGSNALFILDKQSDTFEYTHKVPHENLSFEILFRNVFVNSTLMIRKNIMLELGGYRDEYYMAEDFDLSQRIIERYEAKNIDETLIKYRIHDQNISYVNADKVRLSELKVINNMHKFLGLETNDTLLNAHHDIYTDKLNSESVLVYKSLLEQLLERNKKLNVYPAEKFKSFIYLKWYHIIRTQAGRKSLKYYLYNYRLLDSNEMTFKHFRKIFKQSLGIKC